jgi:hypothetical protein
MRFARWLAVPVGACTLVGCANIHAKKVPVDDRLAGTDHHVKGFRYYLPRPYVVVAEAVPIASESEEAEFGALAHLPDGTRVDGFRSAMCESGRPGQHRLYDRCGNPLNPAEWSWVGAYTAGKAVAPSSPVPKGGTTAPSEPPKTTPPKGVPTIPPATVNPPMGGAAAATTTGSSDTSGGGKTLGPAVGTFAAGGTVSAGGTATGATGATGDDGPAPSRLQVIMLPDFEEQMAVQNRTFVAKSKYDLHFIDGWQLDSVNGTWNATELPIRILQSITKTIKAAEALQLQAMETAAKVRAKGPRAEERANVELEPVLVTLTRHYYLEPGVYRVQKSWERQPCDAPTVGLTAGLLTDMGLEVRQRVTITPHDP